MRALLKRIKMPPDAVTTPDAAKALGLHLAGYTYVEIAAELGCTPDEPTISSGRREGNEAIILADWGPPVAAVARAAAPNPVKQGLHSAQRRVPLVG
jgi:hypothetical protein